MITRLRRDGDSDALVVVYEQHDYSIDTLIENKRLYHADPESK